MMKAYLNRTRCRFLRMGTTMVMALACLVLAGCTPRATESSKAAPPAPAAPPAGGGTAPTPTLPAGDTASRQVFDQNIPTRPNPKLQTLKLYVGSHELKTELALTELQIRTGMMFRTNILEDEAMLFVFGYPHQSGFWMKNVDIPLSCAYIDPEGTILETHDMEPHNENAIESQSARVQYVLETRHGWFERNGVGPGVLIRTERGSLRETFFGRSP